MRLNWKLALIDLYDRNADHAGEIEYKSIKDAKGNETLIPYTLSPVYHTTVNAAIEVTIDEHGNFLGAREVPKNEQLTVIPITEKAISRTTNVAPYPLCDNGKYLAGDIAKYTEISDKYYKAYIEQLSEWSDYANAHIKIKAIYLYEAKGTLISDLLQSDIIPKAEDGTPDFTYKFGENTFDKTNIRFVVEEDDIFNNSVEACWADKTLFTNYIEYFKTHNQETDLDYITGEYQIPFYSHPKKIVSSAANAKIISSEDHDFVYHGLFTSDKEAICIGGESSQKLHNALAWIIKKQGRTFGNMTIVAWETTGMNEYLPKIDASSSNFEKDLDAERLTVSGMDEARRFLRVISGIEPDTNFDSTMHILTLNVATAGRVSITGYKTMYTTEYVKNAKKWYSDCEWMQATKSTKKKDAIYTYVGSLGIREIIDLLYGAENAIDKSIKVPSDFTIIPELYNSLLSCILRGKPIPNYMVDTIVDRASKPLAYKSRLNYMRVLGLAGSLVKKHEKDTKKGSWNMALDKDCTDRDYLYGRLLAVADKAEELTYGSADNGRITNAKRYMERYRQRPYETWQTIEKSLQPYVNKLSEKDRKYIEKTFASIYDKFDLSNFTDNSKLSGVYLLGYHTQLAAIEKYKYATDDN